jgi:hypothetical protein
MASTSTRHAALGKTVALVTHNDTQHLGVWACSNEVQYRVLPPSARGLDSFTLDLRFMRARSMRASLNSQDAYKARSIYTGPGIQSEIHFAYYARHIKRRIQSRSISTGPLICTIATWT